MKIRSLLLAGIAAAGFAGAIAPRNDPAFELIASGRRRAAGTGYASPGGRAHRRWRVRRWAGKNGR